MTNQLPKVTERIYISVGDASWGDANTVVLSGLYTDEELEDMIHGSDSENRDTALDLLNDQRGIRLTDIIDILRDAQNDEGDWRGAIDYVLDILDPTEDEDEE